jgi:hypothetical protein
MNISPEWANVFVGAMSIVVTTLLATVSFWLQWYLSHRDKRPPPITEVRVKRKRR